MESFDNLINELLEQVDEKKFEDLIEPEETEASRRRYEEIIKQNT